MHHLCLKIISQSFEMCHCSFWSIRAYNETRLRTVTPAEHRLQVPVHLPADRFGLPTNAEHRRHKEAT